MRRFDVPLRYVCPRQKNSKFFVVEDGVTSSRIIGSTGWKRGNVSSSAFYRDRNIPKRDIRGR